MERDIIKLEIFPTKDATNFQIIGQHRSGVRRVWGNCRALQSAKNMITMHSKRLGLDVADDGLSATGK